MSYDMQAEGNNGVSSQTNVGTLPGFTDSSVLSVDASVGASTAISAVCNSGNGVHGQSSSLTDSGVWGENIHGGFGVSGSTSGGVPPAHGGPRGIIAGVWGTNFGLGAGVRGTNLNDDGVFGEGSVGVHGISAAKGQGGSAQGWGVFGEATGDGGAGVVGNARGGSGSAGVSGSSFNNYGPATGVLGMSFLTQSGVQGDGVVGLGKNGVRGESGSATDSGVWGNNVSAGYGVSGSTNSQAPQAGVWGHNYGSGYGVRGDSVTGEGVFGLGKNGVHGQSTSAADSGVWGENTGSGAGLGGSSVGGYGGDLNGGRAPLRLRPSGSPGSPTTGSHARGELFVDSTGSLFYCKADGVPGTWIQLA